MIRSVLFLFCLLGGVAFAQTQYPRTMYVAFDKAPLYDSADYLAPVSAELALGDSIRVMGTAGKFFQVEHAGRVGYVLGANLTLAASKRQAKQTREKETATRSSEPKREAPASSTSTETKTTTQCTATTRAGSRCTRMVEAPQSLCWQHRR